MKPLAGAMSATGASRPPAGLAAVLTALWQAPLGVAIFDTEMRYLAASAQFITDQGLPPDTLLVGRRHYDVFPEIPQRWRDIHARCLTDGLEMSEAADLWEHDGRRDWIRWSIAPWRSDHGEIGGVVLYVEIVTEAVEARQRLEAAESRYRAVFDQVAVGAARVAPDGRFLEVNDRFCEITRWNRDALLTRTFQDITHPDDLAADTERVAAMLAGEITTFAMDKRYVTPEGDGVVWVNLTVALVHKADGSPDYFVSIVEDIGVRKAAEAEQQHYQSRLRLLINELNHRVKNTLATVQSMAAQTMRSGAPAESAYETFEARLMGLSEVHDVLTRESWHGADLREVADRALRPFGRTASGRFGVAGPPVRLQPNAALTLALVFHELATNAVKYGALSCETGRVDLAWALDDAGTGLRLTWVESGGPRVSPPTRKGFGSRLIERGLSGDLRGAAIMTWRPGGLMCEMNARLPDAPPDPPPG